jgi:CubicO group peptidase (beta-lactamase class C family)
MQRKFFVIALLLVTVISHSQTNPFQKKFPLVDRYVDSLMKDWNIPGLAIGIVYKDQLIYAKGFGYRDLENKIPVQTTTLFPIASNTKLFTATTACMLAEEGKINLDKPVRNYLPSLNFSNDELNAKVTLRDMLSHRTGLPRYDGIWVASPFTRKQAVEKVAYMKPQLGFREGYLYNNMMYATAGAVLENVTGMSWEDLIRKRIFQPLQMSTSCFSNEDMWATSNFSWSYFEPDSTRKLAKEEYAAQSDALGPAGTIKSSVQDMSHWMIAQLNGGRYNGQQVLSSTAIKQTLIPNNIADKEGKWDELSNSLYCMGRVIQTYKGYKITTHTGSIDGFYSNLTFIPSENLGIFMVENGQRAGDLRGVMAFAIIDRLLGLTITPWSERYMKQYAEDRAANKRFDDSVAASQVQNTVPSHPLKDYAGVYLSPIYGELTIELENNQLYFLFRKQRSLLYHFHYDQFVTEEAHTDKPDFRLNFLTNNKGEIDRISMRPFGDPITEFIKK